MKKINIFLIIALILSSYSVLGFTTPLDYYKLDNNLNNELPGRASAFFPTNNYSIFKINNGTIHNNQGLDLDGINGAGEILKNGSSWSINFWFLSTSTLANYARLIGDNNGGNDWSFMLECTDSTTQLKMRYRDLDAIDREITGIGRCREAGTEAMVTITFDTTNNTMYVYYNGTIKNSRLVNSNLGATTLSNLTMGCDKLLGGCSGDFVGKYDEIGVWNIPLTPAEITELFNSGSGLTYTYSTPISPNFTATANNTWNNGSINEFNLTMSNGAVVYNFESVAGNLNTNISINDTNLWNLTYWNIQNFFNSSYYYINVSTNHFGYLNQSIINLSLKNIVDNTSFINYTAYFNNTIFCNNTNGFCLNTPIATYYNITINPNDGTSFHYPSSNITITALQNNTLTLYAHEHQINVTAKDIITNASINNFSINIKSFNSSYAQDYTTTTGLVEAFTIHNTYNVTIDAPGYALYNNTQNVIISTKDEAIIFYLEKDNGVTINIYSENNGSSLNGTSVTIYTYLNSSLIRTNTTSVGTISFYSLTPGNYTYRFEADNFAVKEYYILVGNRSFQYLNAYLLQTSYNTIFTFLDESNGNTIQDVTLIVKRYINSTLQVVSSLTSDITGRVQLNYQQNIPYYFTASHSSYNTKEFTLNPIIFSSYNVKLTPLTSQQYVSDYSGVTITHTPTYLNNDETNNLTFTFGSPQGKLTEYGYNISFNGQFNSTSGVNAYGSILSTKIYITGANFQDTAVIYYYYTTSDGATNYYALNMPIVGAQAGNYTLFSNKGKTYGLGDFERILLVTFMVILVVGAGTMFGGALIGAVMGSLIFGFFAYMQFISWWAVYPSLVFLFIYAVWGSSK